MTYDKLPDLFSFMPRSSVYINPNFITFETMPYMFQDVQKAITITFSGSNESTFAQKRGHPAREIQTLPMLAARRDLKRLASLCPASAQSRMQAKTCLILEDNRLSWLKGPEFFLTTDENAWHPRIELEYKHDWHASSYNPAGASNTALAEPSNSLQNTFSNAQQTWDHPKQHETNQTPEDFFLDDPPIAEQSPCSVALDGQLEALVKETPHHARSHPESSDSSSCGSDLIPELPIPNAGPPIPAIRPQFLYQSVPPELYWQQSNNRSRVASGCSKDNLFMRRV
jgi:hypothetical protein